MPDATDRRFLVKVSVVTVALVALALAAALAWRPVLIAYHKRCVGIAVRNGAPVPHTGSGRLDGNQFAYLHSVRRLIELGHLQERRFELENTSVHDAFTLIDMLAGAVPGIAQIECVDSPLALLVVASPERMTAVEDFVRLHDVRGSETLFERLRQKRNMEMQKGIIDLIDRFEDSP